MLKLIESSAENYPSLWGAPQPCFSISAGLSEKQATQWTDWFTCLVSANLVISKEDGFACAIPSRALDSLLNSVCPNPFSTFLFILIVHLWLISAIHQAPHASFTSISKLGGRRNNIKGKMFTPLATPLSKTNKLLLLHS